MRRKVQRQVVAVGRLQVGVTALVEHVGNLCPDWVEIPERRAADVASITCRQRVFRHFVEFVDYRRIREEVEVVLVDLLCCVFDIFAILVHHLDMAAVGEVFAAQSGYDAQVLDVVGRFCVDAEDVFVVVVVMVLVEVAFERFAVVGRVVHLVERILGAGCKAPFRREMLVEVVTQIGYVVGRQLVAVFLVDGWGVVGVDERTHKVVVVLGVVRVVVVGNHFHRRAERVESVDVVERSIDVVRNHLRTILAVDGFVGEFGAGCRFSRVFPALVVHFEAERIVLVRVVEHAGIDVAEDVVVGSHFGGVVVAAAVGIVGGLCHVDVFFWRIAHHAAQRVGPVAFFDVQRCVGGKTEFVFADVGADSRATHNAVGACLFHRYLDDARRRICAIFGAGLRDDFHFGDFLGFQVAQKVHQLVFAHLHLAVVHVDYRPALAVD